MLHEFNSKDRTGLIVLAGRKPLVCVDRKGPGQYFTCTCGPMLDHMGFVSELNDANLFMIRKGTGYTPLPDACLAGIAMDVCRDPGIPLPKRSLSVAEFYRADVIFATGTMGGSSLLTEIDGKKTISRSSHNTLKHTTTGFRTLISQYSEKTN